MTRASGEHGKPTEQAEEPQQTQPDSDDNSVPWHSANFQIILASTMMGIMGVSLVSPILPQMKGVFGVSDAAVGLVVPAFTFPGILLSPFAGIAADRYGRRATLVPLLILFGIGGTAVAFATSFTQVLLFRAVQGVGGSALIMLAITLIGDYYEDEQRSAAIGLNGGAIGSSGAIFPLVGGALAALGWYVPFYFYAIAVGIGLYALYSLDEPSVEEQGSTREYFSQMLSALSYPRSIVFNALVFATYFVFYGGLLTAVPLLLGSEYGLASGEIGLLIAVMSVASASTNAQYGRISEMAGANSLIAIGGILCGGALLGLSAGSHVVLVGLALFVFGVGFGLVQPSLDNVIVSFVPSNMRAGMMSVRTSTLRLGQTAGPVVFTLVASGDLGVSVGYTDLFSGIGAVACVSGLLALLTLHYRGTGAAQ